VAEFPSGDRGAHGATRNHNAKQTYSGVRSANTMSIFNRAEQIAADIKHTATEVLTKIFGADAVAKFESDIEAIFRADVLAIFEDAVTAAESLVIPGAEGAPGTPATGEQKR